MPRGLLHSAMTGAVIVLGKHMVRLWVRTPVILTDVFMVFFLFSFPPGKLRDRNLVKRRRLPSESFPSSVALSLDTV